MNWFWKTKNQSVSELLNSSLYNENTFYKKFISDLIIAREEVIIESPYTTNRRLEMLKPIFNSLINRRVKVFVITKSPEEQDEFMAGQSEEGIQYFESIGIQVLLIKGSHHRKLAIIDRKILWEGSLNILSQYKSREIMRRMNNKAITEEMFYFLKLSKVI